MWYPLENIYIDRGDNIGDLQWISHHILWINIQQLFYCITNEQIDKEFNISSL